MSIKPNYEKGRRYFWIHSSMLFLDFVGFRPKRLIVDTHKPKGKGYHRIKIEVVRTKAECDALNQKFKRKRERLAKLIASRAAIDAARKEQP